MKLVSLAVLTILGSSSVAIAQEVMPELPVPTLSETDEAQPDWYQQFTFSNNDIRNQVWQAEPNQTFKLAWVKGDRWSISVDLTSRDEGTPVASEEMSAGAEFRITPRLSVGGELSIETKDTATSVTDYLTSDETETGIRLRSAFKF